MFSRLLLYFAQLMQRNDFTFKLKTVVFFFQNKVVLQL